MSRSRATLRGTLAALVLLAAISPARSEQVKIGIGFGLAFLPFYIINDLHLFEKHAKVAGLDVKVSYPRYPGALAMQYALTSGAIDFAPFGVSGLLLAREKTRGTPQEIVAVSGVTTLPLTLLTARPDIQSLDDLKAKDRIAVPVMTAPQTYLLRMHAEKKFGQADRLRSHIVALPHQDSVEALSTGTGDVAAYFSSPPFTQLALRDGKMRPLLSSPDVIGGKASFLVLGATRRTVELHPKWADLAARAMDEAADVIRKDPRRAAQVFLKFEPSQTLDVRMLEGILRDLKDDFGSDVHGVKAYADFMTRHGRLKIPLKDWKDVVTPTVAAQPGS